MSGSQLLSATQLLAMDPRPLILDATLTLAPGEPSAASRFAQGHIEGAVFFDLNAICDPSSPFPRMLPDPSQLRADFESLGLIKDEPVVVYDQDGLYSAPRVWWMLRCLGHGPVFVLDGGMPAWEKAGGRVLSEPATDFVRPTPMDGTGAYPSERVADARAVALALQDTQSLVVDARSRARFAGEVPERSAQLQCGHMPGAKSLPYTELLTPEGTLIDKAGLQSHLQRLDPDRRVQSWVSSCGSGVTACVFALAMEHHLGIQVRVYDASWSEWGRGEVGEIQRG